MAVASVGNRYIGRDTAGKGYMGKKDLVGKDFFADRKRFAELLNVILYQGKEVIRAESLELVHRNYPAFSGKGEAGRDIFMRDADQNICYGLELETESDRSMPERVMVYDACELEWQIKEINKEHREKQPDGEKLDYQEKKSRMKETDYLLPAVTVVLYLGTDHWSGGRKLSELYRLPAEIQSCLGTKLPDYKFPLAEADFVETNNFKTDLKEFFQVMQCRKDKGRLRGLLKTEHFRHLSEDTAWAIAVHLDRKRLTAKVKKEGLSVCVALDELLEDERMMGKKEERSSIIRKMVKEGMSQETIRRVTGCSQKELVSVIGKKVTV